MKHVVIISNQSTTGYLFRKEVMERLLREGCRVTFIGDILLFKEEMTNMGCTLIDIRTGRRNTNVFQDIGLFLTYFSVLSRCKPDIVLTFNIKPNVYAGMACTLLRIPYITNITGLGKPLQNPGLLRALTTVLYRIGAANASAVLFQNVDNEQFFRERHILSAAARTVLLPGSGVNLEQHCFEPYPPENSEGKLLFLIIGRIMQEKGIEEVLYAAEKVKAEFPQVTFRFLGDYDGNYEDRIKQAVAQGIVEYCGHVPDVHLHMKESHATIHASHHEGMANVLLETAACGRPIIATDIPGCREAFDEGVSGLSCAPRDGDSLAEAIRRFICLPYAEKQSMGIAAREKMERKFDRNIVVEAYWEEINRSLEKNSAVSYSFK